MPFLRTTPSRRSSAAEPEANTGVAWNVRRVLAKTPSRRHFESKWTSKTGSTSKIGSRNGFVRFGKFCIVRSLSPYGVLNSGHKLTVTYYGEITIEPILNPEFDVNHDFEVKNGSFQSLFPRFRVISAFSTGRASHSDHFSGQVSMATILQDFNLFRRGFQLGTRGGVRPPPNAAIDASRRGANVNF